MYIKSFSKNLGLITLLMTALIQNANAESVTTERPSQEASIVSAPGVSDADKWAMMALGIGLVGLRLRSKQNRHSSDVK